MQLERGGREPCPFDQSTSSRPVPVMRCQSGFEKIGKRVPSTP